MEIPWQDLDEDTLDRLLSEIVTRDGTDYGLVETSTATKIRSVRKALASGSLLLLWDAESESAALKSANQVREEAAQLDRLKRQSGIKPKETNHD